MAGHDSVCPIPRGGRDGNGVDEEQVGDRFEPGKVASVEGVECGFGSELQCVGR